MSTNTSGLCILLDTNIATQMLFIVCCYFIFNTLIYLSQYIDKYAIIQKETKIKIASGASNTIALFHLEDSVALSVIIS